MGDIDVNLGAWVHCVELDLLGCAGRGVGGFSGEFGGSVFDAFVGRVYVVQENLLCLVARGGYSAKGKGQLRAQADSQKGVRLETTDKEVWDSLPFEEDIDAVPAERTAVLK